jgi:hypothetical protein
MESRDDNALAGLGHEPIETDVRAVWRTGAALVGVVVTALLLVAGMMNWLEDAEGDAGAEIAATTGVNWSERIPLKHLRDQQQQWLDSHAWVDRDAGVARIPIARAMEIIYRNGLPTTLQIPPSLSADSTPQSNTQVAPPPRNEGTEP